MNTDFTRTLILARKQAGFTQEQAAERLDLSRRGLAYYEEGRTPPDATVARMIKVYSSQYLGYMFLSLELETGRLILPKIVQRPGLASGIMSIHVSIEKAARMYGRLEEIVCDELIDDTEIADYDRCWHELDDLLMSITAMKYAGHEKNRPAGTGRLKRKIL